MHSVYALRIHCMAGRVVWSADSIFGSATFTTDSSMRDIDDPSTAAASTHSFRAAHAGTDRVARIVTSSQGREVALDIAGRQRAKGTRKIHVSHEEQLPVMRLQYFFPIVPPRSGQAH